MLAGVLVGLLVELADQFLKDCAHRVIVYPVGMEVHVFEPLDEHEEEADVLQRLDGIAELEVINDLSHIGGKAVEISDEVLADVLRVFEELLKIERGDIIESVSGRVYQGTLNI
jgi:hypothetical protein